MARDEQLALFVVAAVAISVAPAKPKKNQQDIRAKQTREEREQDEQAFWSGLSCRIPPRGVPSLWSCFGSKGERFMCSWCGWSFERRTGAITQAVGPTARGCPQCPVEHPELRPTRLPVDEDQEELFDSISCFTTPDMTRVQFIPVSSLDSDVVVSTTATAST